MTLLFPQSTGTALDERPVEPAEVPAMATEMNDVAVGSELALLWQRHRQISLDRISLIEATTANVLRSLSDGDSISEAASAAHKLAGSLGIFGFDDGSRAALEAEHLLRQPEIDGRRLAEAVVALRASVRDQITNSVVVLDQESKPAAMSSTDAAFLVLSLDADLISGLTVEAAAIGFSVVSSAIAPDLDAPDWGYAAVVIDEGSANSLIGWDGLVSVTAMEAIADSATVVVLTDRDAFEDRAEFAKARVVSVMRRSERPSLIVSSLAEAVARVHSVPSVVLSLNASAGLEDALHRALEDSDCHLDTRSSGMEMWDALEEQGADLVVVGFTGSDLSGPELCRMIRAHPRWHRLPVVVMGGRSRSQLDESFAAGADDYLNVGMSSHDLGVRLHHLLTTSRQSEARSDTDPVTSTGNRSATERALDLVFRLASDKHEPFTLALVTIDHFDHIRATEGTVVGNSVLRRLGAHLVGACRGDDIAGRWTEDGFAIGLHGASGPEASERIAGVLKGLVAEGTTTTWGDRAHYTFSAGVASTPADGSSLASLKRICETALRRAGEVGNSVVTSEGRSARPASDVIDVVLVEDDDAMADVIEYALGLRQYRFMRFSDGADAATALGQGHVRAKVVLLDVGLPSLDGFGVLQVLNGQGVLNDTRVIMLTARSSEEETLRAIGLGATDHITKPFSIPVLLARLDQAQIGDVA